MVYTEIVIAGCGNPLFADDGFGIAIAEELKKIPLPENITVLDTGTSAPVYLFPLLDPGVTKKLIVIDIADFKGRPGSVIRFQIGDFRPDQIHDFQVGGIIEPLYDLSRRINITLIVCQPKHIPYPELEIGLSDEVQDAIPSVIRYILDLLEAEWGISADAPVYITCTDIFSWNKVNPDAR